MVLDEFKEFDKAMEEGDILPLGQVRKYIGILTGKTVKVDPEGSIDFNKISKGDKVVVMHLEDYAKYDKGMNMLLTAIRKDISDMKKDKEEARPKKEFHL